MPYPPLIDDTSFPAPPLQGAIVNACPLHEHACSLESLSVAGETYPAAHSGFNTPHGVLAPNAPGRIVLAPGSDPGRIEWQLTGHQRIVRLVAEIHRWRHPVPIWTRSFEWAPAQRRPVGSTPFGGLLRPMHALTCTPPGRVIQTFPAHATFPNLRLTAEHAPYKVTLRIDQVEDPTAITTSTRWCYVDIVVGRISVFVTRSMADPPRPLDQHAVLSLQDQLGPKNELTDPNLPPDGLRIDLKTNVFKRSGADMYTNTVYAGMKALWGNGPEIPVRAAMRLRRANNGLASAVESAHAIGNLPVHWDWVSAGRRLPRSTAQNYIRAALDYKMADWPHARGNCHFERGGRRASFQAACHFKATSAMSDTHFAPAHRRPWAATTMTNAEGRDAGQTAVTFNPSHIAGDSYRLIVAVGHRDRNQLDIEDPVGFDRILHEYSTSVVTAPMTIWREITVARHWRKTEDVDAAALDWSKVNDRYFKDIYVKLTPPPRRAEVIPPADFQASFLAVSRVLPRGVTLAFEPGFDQAQGPHGLTLADYTSVRRTATPLILTELQQLRTSSEASRDPLTAHTNMLGLSRHPSRADLVVDTPQLLLHEDENVVNELLAKSGLKKSSTLGEQGAEWAHRTLDMMCGHYVRHYTPMEAGIHFFHFDFVDQHYRYTTVAEALDSIPHCDSCSTCGGLFPAHGDFHWDRDFSRSNRLCSTLNCPVRADDACVVMATVPLCYIGGDTRHPTWSHLSYKERRKIEFVSSYKTTVELNIAHEIGHQLGLPHAGPDATILYINVTNTGGIKSSFHDADDDACLMSYNFKKSAELHFCGVCALRIAGWSMGPSREAIDFPATQFTKVLWNRARDSQALSPDLGARVQNQQARCQAPSCPTPKARCQSCPICGDHFCHQHRSQQRQPVIDPLSLPMSWKPEQVRVCDECARRPLRHPQPGASWVADIDEDRCQAPGCSVVYGKTTRHHHCRCCGHTFCNNHSRSRITMDTPLKPHGRATQLYVCKRCERQYPNN